MPVLLPSSFPPIGNPLLFSNQKKHTHVENINFLNFHEVLFNWDLIESREPTYLSFLYHDLITNDLTLLDKGFRNRNKNSGKLSDLSFNLINEHTWSCCFCCHMDTSFTDINHYICSNKPCGKKRFCPRCAFRTEQAFAKKFSSHFSPKYDYHHITLTDPDFYFLFLSNLSYNLNNFQAKLKKAKNHLALMINGRTRHKFPIGSIWNMEAACINLFKNQYNAHLHIILAAHKGSCIDLSPFEDIGLQIHSVPILTQSHFNNCLRYIHKPMTETIKDRYAIEYSPSTASTLYQNINNGLDDLQMIFSGKKYDTQGIFRLSLED
jgi:hypothetical protein